MWMLPRTAISINRKATQFTAWTSLRKSNNASSVLLNVLLWRCYSNFYNLGEKPLPFFLGGGVGQWFRLIATLRTSLNTRKCFQSSRITPKTFTNVAYVHVANRFILCFNSVAVVLLPGGLWATLKMCWVWHSLPITARLCQLLAITPLNCGTHWESASTPYR